MSIVISLATSPMSFLRNELTTRPSRNAAIISSSCRTFVLRITCWMKCLSWANISQETTKRPHHPKTHGCLNITGLLALFSRRTWRNLDSPGSFATLDNNLPHQTNDWSYMRMVEWCGVRGGKWKCIDSPPMSLQQSWLITCHSDMVPVLSTELIFLMHWGTHVNLEGCNKLRRRIESTLCWLKIIWPNSVVPSPNMGGSVLLLWLQSSASSTHISTYLLLNSMSHLNHMILGGGCPTLILIAFAALINDFFQVLGPKTSWYRYMLNAVYIQEKRPFQLKLLPHDANNIEMGVRRWGLTCFKCG